MLSQQSTAAFYIQTDGIRRKADAMSNDKNSIPRFADNTLARSSADARFRSHKRRFIGDICYMLLLYGMILDHKVGEAKTWPALTMCFGTEALHGHHECIAGCLADAVLPRCRDAILADDFQVPAHRQ